MLATDYLAPEGSLPRLALFLTFIWIKAGRLSAYLHDGGIGPSKGHRISFF